MIARSSWADRMSACCRKKAAKSPTSISWCAAKAKMRGSTSATGWKRSCKTSRSIHTEAFMHPENEIFDDCLGITYKTSDGQIHNNPDRTPIADLDSLPWPAYHLFKMERYTNLQPATDHVDGARSFSIMTSRGCPYRCTFCSQSIMPIKWRSRSPESVLAEWRHLVEDLGAQEIGVLDDSANIRVKRLEEIAHLLIENDLNHVPWIFVNGIRANLASKELLVVAQAGRPQAHRLWRGKRRPGDSPQHRQEDRSRYDPPGFQERQGDRAGDDRAS